MKYLDVRGKGRILHASASEGRVASNAAARPEERGGWDARRRQAEGFLYAMEGRSESPFSPIAMLCRHERLILQCIALHRRA
jgi:hypothetical protein